MKSLKKTRCPKIFIVACRQLISSLNFYCCNFNGRAVPWAFPLEFVCKSRLESGVQCVTNGERKLEQLAKIIDFLSHRQS